MKRWGVFTNFYNGITIDGREVFLDDYDTKDAALEEAIHNCILILEQFRRYDVFCECITEEKEPYSNIGIHKLREITDKDDKQLVLWVGSKRLIKRKALEKYIDQSYSI